MVRIWRAEKQIPTLRQTKQNKSTSRRVCIVTGMLVVILWFSIVVLGPSIMASDTASAFSAPQPRGFVGPAQIYQEIAKRTNEMEFWPDDTNAKILFDKDEHGAYQIPSFPEQDAPLAVVAIVDRNHDAAHIMKYCDGVFNEFCQDLKEVLVSTGNRSFEEVEREMEKYIWRVPFGSHHSTVAVFQENPQLLLDESEKKKWHRVEEAVAEKLFETIATYQELNICSPRLSLNSILLTPDGAMIAGFVDKSSHCAYQKLRTSSIEMAETAIGELTSRPKKLIHVTAGRVLSLPHGVTDGQKRAVMELTRRYNTEVLPQRLKQIHKSMAGGATWSLTELTMIRDVVWTLRKIKEYGSWHLKSPP